MSGWFPAPAGRWPELVEFFGDNGPWPEDLVIMDLRWHVDQQVPLPGRPALMLRWKWTDRAVRTLLADEDRWRPPRRKDPKTGVEAPHRPLLRTTRAASRQRAPASASERQQPPASASDDTDLPHLPPEDVQPAPASASERQQPPASVHTREGGTPSPADSSPPSPPEQDEIEKTRANAGDSAVFVRAKDKPIRKTQEETWQVQRCATLAGVAVLSGMSVVPPKIVERIVDAVRQGWTDADFDVVWAWSVNSAEADLARRRTGVERWSWLLADQRENRRTAAKEWDRRGRIDTSSPARSPPPNGRAASMIDVLRTVSDPTYYPGD